MQVDKEFKLPLISPAIFTSLVVSFLVFPQVLLYANTLRPPSVPLVFSDPYFSIWSPGSGLAETNTIHWTGTSQSLTMGAEGNELMDRYRGPGYANLDLSIMKNNRIAGKVNLQLRFEFFNLLNRANLNWVDNNLADATFGEWIAIFNPRAGAARIEAEFLDAFPHAWTVDPPLWAAGLVCSVENHSPVICAKVGTQLLLEATRACVGGRRP